MLPKIKIKKINSFKYVGLILTIHYPTIEIDFVIHAHAINFIYVLGMQEDEFLSNLNITRISGQDSRGQPQWHP